MPAAKTQSKPKAKPAPSIAPPKGVVPYLSIRSASDAAKFYAKAFGAAEVFRYPVDEQGRTMHIHLHINGGSLMLSDAYPEQGHPLQAPQGYTLQLCVDDIDAWWKRAVAAGCEIVLPLQKMFWGDHYGQLRDAFGVLWAMNMQDSSATPKK